MPGHRTVRDEDLILVEPIVGIVVLLLFGHQPDHSEGNVADENLPSEGLAPGEKLAFYLLAQQANLACLVEIGWRE